jgi:hypothetical protein
LLITGVVSFSSGVDYSPIYNNSDSFLIADVVSFSSGVDSPVYNKDFRNAEKTAAFKHQ